ncbi:hypothetical protein PVK06_024866 [Gossypium arboreum]|uniref:Reverse transcriptase Ty1/copia-type domain-containing protein n=1 Tax=Gossypium arboreum TaxID=29729 RepID=A0ABR0PFB5_GOSAR|nr:hypothetical protein PVK06_024866 [Gossypium arboreum]
MSFPNGFKVPNEEDKVYKLKKALYGLKQASRDWYDRVDAYLSRLGFEKTVSEPTLYVKKSENETLLIVSLYVDDLLLQNCQHTSGSRRKTIAVMKGLIRRSIGACDWAGSIDDMKNTSGYFFTLSSGVFCWISKKQQTVAQSIAEAEYIATTIAVNQAIRLRKLLCDLNEEQIKATEIRIDNQSIVAIAKNHVFHGKTKHFKINFIFFERLNN